MNSYQNKEFPCLLFMNKFDCLVNEMPYLKQLVQSLNVQVDSIRAKVFV